MIRVDEFLLDALEYSRSLPDLSFVHKGKKVLVIGFTPQWISYMSLVSVALVHRGCNIDFLWTPNFEHDNADGLDVAQQMHKYYYPTFAKVNDERFNPINLQSVPLKNLTEEELKEVTEQAQQDTIHIAREVRIDINGFHKDMYRSRLHVLHEFAGALVTLFEENEYDTILTPNGQIFEWAITRRLALMRKIPVCTLESFIGGSDFQICASWTQPAINWDTAIVKEKWKQAEPHFVTPEVKGNVAKIMEIFDDVDDIYSHQFIKSGNDEKIRQSLQLDPSKPVVLVMPSLGHEKHNRISHYGFKDHVEWFNETVSYLAQRSDCNVIIRSHPFPYDAIKDPLDHGASKELPEVLIEKLFSVLPDHFRFIGAKEEYNTYDILKIGDFLVTHHSTTGLEASVLGKAAVICSSINYADKGFTFDPKTKEEYFNIINMLIKHPDKAKLSERQIELALCYMDFFYFRWPFPFPWNIMRAFFKKDYSFERVLTLEILLHSFTQTFDYLVDPLPIDNQVRQKEISIYISTAKKYLDDGNLGDASKIIGDCRMINFDHIRATQPELFDFIKPNISWLCSNFSNSPTSTG